MICDLPVVLLLLSETLLLLRMQAAEPLSNIKPDQNSKPGQVGLGVRFDFPLPFLSFLFHVSISVKTAVLLQSTPRRLAQTFCQVNSDLILSSDGPTATRNACWLVGLGHAGRLLTKNNTNMYA
ncbi:hypothetical protein BS78_08G012200 [Paspalum vaginatum]|nr:hypothetical protein BS78_08G012200 [Paspalum vaginatum]